MAKEEGRFSLIELLVTVSILSILASMLLPAFSRAKEMSRRGVCVSNLKQLGLIMVMYADDYDERVPLCYNGIVHKQSNYDFWYDTGAVDGYYTVHGYYMQAGYITEGKFLYCPSNKITSFHYDDSNNPWPPGSVVDKRTRAGYSTRSVAPAGDLAPEGTVYPQLGDYNEKAVEADISCLLMWVPEIHLGDGMNVMWGDGAANWLDYDKYANSMSVLVGTTFDSGLNSAVDDLWTELDTRR